MIRPIEKSDRAPVMNLLQATGNFTAAELAIAAELVDIVLSKSEQNDYHAFVHDREPGVGGLVILGPVPATVGSWHMYWIAVHPDSQGTGIAQKLDQWAESFVRSRGAYWLIAETSGQPSYERTRAFYRKQGYQELARIPDYYKPSDDLFIFGKRLKEAAPRAITCLAQNLPHHSSMSDFTLQKHKLQHLGTLKVSPDIFRSTYNQNCATSCCPGSCCAGGVWVDLIERDRILAHAGQIQEHMEPGQEKDPARWFDSERLKSGDFPSGEAAGTEVYNDSCVFLDSSKRCVLQKAADVTTGQLKPFFCFAFPITIEEGVLQLDDGKDPQCCLVEAGGGHDVLDLCEEELKHVLGDEGFQEFRSLANSQSQRYEGLTP